MSSSDDPKIPTSDPRSPRTRTPALVRAVTEYASSEPMETDPNDPMETMESIEVMLSNGEDTVTVLRPKPKLDNEQEQLKEQFKATGAICGIPMDDENAAAAAVLSTEGSEAASKFMFTRSDGTIRSYGEMRSLYG